jgi:hypothetical protein
MNHLAAEVRVALPSISALMNPPLLADTGMRVDIFAFFETAAAGDF